jgi:hypothetical protein
LGSGYDITGNGVQLLAAGLIATSNSTGANEADLAFAHLGATTLHSASASTPLYDFTDFNGNLCSAERCPNVYSSVLSEPFYVTTLQTTVEIDAGTVINNGAIGGSVDQNGGTPSGTGTVGRI